VSALELESLLTMLRSGGPDLAAPPPQARENFEAMLAGIPTPEVVTFEATTLGGVPARWSDTPGASTERVLFYLHGGAYLLGSSFGYRPLFSALARAAGARGLALDYRLAPENPFPAAVDDAVSGYRALLSQGIAPDSIAIAGDSAGGGLTVAMLVAARDAGLPMPAAAVAISPWADLECTGGSMVSKAAEDFSLNREGSIAMASIYLNGASPRSALASPLYANLTGLPPLLIQVGSAEVLLDDATRLAARAAEADVAVQLEVWPRMPHVWHAFAFTLSEGRDAIAAAGAFVSARFQKHREASA
jgi:monoterpene epsilon-lactone hydrolase